LAWQAAGSRRLLQESSIASGGQKNEAGQIEKEKNYTGVLSGPASSFYSLSSVALNGVGRCKIYPLVGIARREVARTTCPSMNKALRSRKRPAKQSARLGAYLAAGVGASMVATSTTNAAIIVLDLGPSGFNILGLNGGVAPGGQRDIANFPVAGGNTLGIFNSPGSYGLGSTLGGDFASGNTAYAYATPTNFAKNALIDGSVTFAPSGGAPAGLYYSLFYYGGITSPDFGPGSYMGFRFANGSDFNYGWLEVTWTAATSEFQILAGAYESDPNVGIAAGAVPEPSTYALLALAAGGGAYLRWRRRRDAAQKEAA
jgi:hypothetical protein